MWPSAGTTPGRRPPLGEDHAEVSGSADVVVTLQYFEGCPNWRVADDRLREALARAARDDVRVEHRVIGTPEEAAAAGFRGSPTILLDEQDPFADPDASVGLSCRIYRTEAGLAGSPTPQPAARRTGVRPPGRGSFAESGRAPAAFGHIFPTAAGGRVTAMQRCYADNASV
jgi:hypothetical protein